MDLSKSFLAIFEFAELTLAGFLLLSRLCLQEYEQSVLFQQFSINMPVAKCNLNVLPLRKQLAETNTEDLNHSSD